MRKAERVCKRVFIVDDHPFMRMGLIESLRREPGLAVCGEAESAEAAFPAVAELHPDVVVADINLPGKGGLDLIKELARLQPSLRMIVLSMHEEGIYAERCLRLGAHGYIMKNEGPEKLAAAIRHVLAGGVYVSEKASNSIVEAFASQRGSRRVAPLNRLSDRELDVFRMIGQGLSTREIASWLRVSIKTVETHRMKVKRKLGQATASGLVAYAARWLESE